MTWAPLPLASLRSRVAMNVLPDSLACCRKCGLRRTDPCRSSGDHDRRAEFRRGKSVPVTITTAGAAAMVQGVTQGISNAEFTASGGTCGGASFTVGQQCTVNVVFQPKYPGTRSGAVRVSAANGTVLGVTLLTGVGTGGLPVLVPGRIDTVIGSGQWIYRGDGVAGNTAPIFLPMGVFVDAAGNMFVSDSNNNRVRRVDARTGLISTVARYWRSGICGRRRSSDASHGELARAALALDGAGNIFLRG